MIAAALGAFNFYNYGPSDSVFGSVVTMVIWFLVGLIIVVLQPYSSK